MSLDVPKDISKNLQANSIPMADWRQRAARQHVTTPGQATLHCPTQFVPICL